MKIFIAIAAIILISINVIAYLIFKKLYKKDPTFPVSKETENEINKVNAVLNTALKAKTTPSLIFLLILQAILIYGFLSQDLKKIKIIQNPKLTHAHITKKYTKKYDDNVYYHVDYSFKVNNSQLSPVSYFGTGKISEKNFNKIDNNTLLKVTYYVDNPQESMIGDITKLTLGKMISNRIIPYSCLGGMYLLTLFGTYFMLFKLKTKYREST